MRDFSRMWRDGRGGRWQRRARLYEGEESCRVELTEGGQAGPRCNLYFRDDGHRARAIATMEAFAAGSPADELDDDGDA
jgi:hypothetical protein